MKSLSFFQHNGNNIHSYSTAIDLLSSFREISKNTKYYLECMI